MKKAILVYVGQSDFSYALAKKRDYSFKREVQIGFAYLAAILAQREVDADILDLTLVPCTPDDLAARIERDKPVFVGFYAAMALKDRVTGFIRALRLAHPKLNILVGGPDVYESDEYLKAGANAYCIGEGERTIVELLEFCRGKMDLAGIKGIAYLDGGQVVHTPHRELIENLDELPLPAWDKFDLNRYYDFHVFDMATPYASIMASRGCPFRCSYCISHNIWEHKLRRRSPEHVMIEIDYLVQKLGVRYITFQDDIWSWNNDAWGRRLCEILIERRYDLKWRCILHPFSFKNSHKEMLPLMKRAGCTSITTGLQSASARILKNIHRSPYEPDALADLIGTMKKVGILNNTAFIFGLPGDDDASMEESVRYALKVKPTFAAFYALSVLPGSAIADMEKRGEFVKAPDELLKRKCREGARRFYTNPLVAMQLIRSVLRVNPLWILKAISRIGYLTQLAGVSSGE